MSKLELYYFRGAYYADENLDNGPVLDSLPDDGCPDEGEWVEVECEWEAISSGDPGVYLYTSDDIVGCYAISVYRADTGEEIEVGDDLRKWLGEQDD